MTVVARDRRPVSERQSPVVGVALVNNMPDSAFEETERQFTRLLRAAAAGGPIELRRSTVADPSRGGAVRRWLSDRYEDLDDLMARPPDAVIVTGTEPRCSDLRDEATWERLAELARWARESTTSVYFSCLASHAALLALHGVERRRLPAKLSGVFPQATHPHHPLVAGLDAVSCPHSRLNDVPTGVVERCGYRVVLASPQAGWSVAVSDGPCLTVLAQGHPEYGRTSLLREYRRDVRRHLAGQTADYPSVPEGYVDDEATELLDLFRHYATRRGPDPGAMDAFPFDACAQHIAVSWRRPMERLFANWIAEVRARTLTPGQRRAG